MADFERQREAGVVFVVFYGINGLPGNAQFVGQMGL
jgi:hypothetical protein